MLKIYIYILKLCQLVDVKTLGSITSMLKIRLQYLKILAYSWSHANICLTYTFCVQLYDQIW